MHGSVRDGLKAQRARLRAVTHSRSFADLWSALAASPSSCAVALDSILQAKPPAGASQDLQSHLDHCSECAEQINEFRSHSEMLRSLRSTEDAEPGPGFYARVLQRIEERATKSMWWIFAYSPVGKRLAYVSLATAIIMGSYVIAQESRDGGLHAGTLAGTLVARGDSSSHYDTIVTGNPDEQRDAVLENFAAHPGKIQ